MALTEGNDPRQALLPIDRTNRWAYALRSGLRAGSLTVCTPQDLPELTGEQRIPTMDQVANPNQEPVIRVSEVTRHLLQPLAVRRDSRNLDLRRSRSMTKSTRKRIKPA